MLKEWCIVGRGASRMPKSTIDVKLSAEILSSLDRYGKLEAEIERIAKKDNNRLSLWYKIVDHVHSEVRSLLIRCRETVYHTMWPVIEDLFPGKIDWNGTTVEYLEGIGFDLSRVKPGSVRYRIIDNYELDLGISKCTVHYAKRLVESGASKADTGQKVKKLVYASLFDFFKKTRLPNDKELVLEFLGLVNWKRVEDILWKNLSGGWSRRRLGEEVP